ncbi:MAG: RagB/SusD family nutrient uptake outer membrane protein [Bacteroidaceae bacterium]|nr:RagB/SusD family nutrient uptake outer membrane protein [Bacteroidaceae bacterium]
MKKIFLFLIAAVALVACDLETPPPTELDTDKALSTYSGVDQATAITYAAFRSSGWYGLNTSLIPDVMCGNCVAGDLRNTQAKTSFQSWLFTSTGGFSVYSNTYGNLIRCNNTIFALKNNAEVYLSEKGVTQQDLDNLMAECLFVRAYCYFDLVRWYAQPYAVAKAATPGDVKSLGMPIVSENPDESAVARPARDLAVDNYKNIISDLTTALKLMEPGYTRANALDQKACASVGAIEALLARVYLYVGDYVNAEKHATNVINSGKYRIANANEYKTLWGEATWTTTPEIIFSAYVDQQDGGGINGGPGSLTEPVEGYGDVRVSKDLLSILDDNDVRKTMLRVSDKVEEAGFFWPNKYQGKPGVNPMYSSLPLIRISEMYLVRAEARYNSGNPNGALDDLNVITSNRNAEPIVVATPDAIFNERRKELAFEGHIYHDYKRLQKDLVRNDMGIMSENKDIPASSYLWCMPIAESEFDVNPNLVQNPGWN